MGGEGSTQTARIIDWRLAGRRASTMLFVGAAVLVLYPLVTMAWAEWATRNVDERLDDAIAQFAAARDRAADVPELAEAFRSQLETGQAIGRLKIKAIGVDEVVFEGSEQLTVEGFDDSLRLGPSRLSWTGLPGEGTNTTIAGHRTTYTRPFWSLDSLSKGDRITLEMPYATFHYEMTEAEVVAPFQTYVAEDHGFEELTLTTCTPRFSAFQRLAVHARLLEVDDA